MVQAQIWSVRQRPSAAPSSYGNIGFAKFGCCCWNYGGYDGEIEFVNTEFFVTQSKQPNPTALRYYAVQGVQMLIQFGITPLPAVQDVQLDGVPTNATTGKNMPLVTE